MRSEIMPLYTKVIMDSVMIYNVKSYFHLYFC